MLRLPIGYDSFGEMQSNQFDFVDKSLFIKEILDDKSKVILITRPRRFGKTFNLSMLEHFLAPKVLDLATKDLFIGLKISEQGQHYLAHQGQYPVVSVTFKDIKSTSYTDAYQSFSKLMSSLYLQHQYVLSSNALAKQHKKNFMLIVEEKANEAGLKAALFDLTQYLALANQQKPWLLIDEYDTPIQSGYLHDYYQPIVNFMREVLGAALKGNPYLTKGVLTGILRISKESLFSGLNNVETYSVLRSEYSQHFGFTEEEVNHLLAAAKLKEQAEAIKQWYNGYQVGNTLIYNPWSIVNCIKQKGSIKPYWVNTSDNELIKQLLMRSSVHFKSQFELLLQDKPIERFVDEDFVFPQLKSQESAVWSLLLMAGYLKVSQCQETAQGSLCQLAIPNQEVRNLYRKIIEQWLANGYGVEWYNRFLAHLLSGHIAGIKEFLTTIMAQTVSMFDVAREPEAFYHGLFIGLTASLDRQLYEIDSNRESGLGRYDILIIAKDSTQPSIILELKSIPTPKKASAIASQLQEAAKVALTQIDKGQYSAILEKRGIKNIVKIGLAFSGKALHVEANV